MALPATIDIAQKYLFADMEEMSAAGIPELIQQRLIRLRDMYNFWLSFPSKKDLEIVSELESRYKIGKSTAYEDVRIIKRVLGDLAKTTKDYHRYKFCNMIDESFAMAKRTKDARAMASAANFYAKYTQLDKEDVLDKGYDKIIVQPFEPTDDPTVLGIKAIPNVRERIKLKIQQYWSDDIEDVDVEEVEFNEDQIFNIKPQNDETVL